MRLKELREEKNLTQNELASFIGTSQANISRWEKGEIEPLSGCIILLADFFGVSSDYLLGRSDDLGNVIVSPTAPALSEKDQQLLALFHNMTNAQQIRYIAYGEGMVGIDIPKFKA